jgi:hypothetical protein
MHRSGDILPGVKIKAIITLGVSIMITLEDDDNNTGSALFLWDEPNSYDFWDVIVFKGETYDMHIDHDEQWAVSLFGIEEVDGRLQVDTGREVGIQESVDGDCFTIIEKCSVSGSIEECEDKDNLVDAVIAQIKEDIENGDTTVLASILETKDTNYLKACLPEEEV